MAMEARCYRGGQGRTRLRQLRLGALDVTALVLVTAYAVAVVAVL